MKETVILFEISGLSLEEIKKIQGGTISGVKSRLKRGRETLEILMKPRNGVMTKNLPLDNDSAAKVFRTHKIEDFNLIDNKLG